MKNRTMHNLAPSAGLLEYHKASDSPIEETYLYTCYRFYREQENLEAMATNLVQQAREVSRDLARDGYSTGMNSLADRVGRLHEKQAQCWELAAAANRLKDLLAEITE